MKKQGFTLLELLAVIVILAMIALIAVPIIMGIIKESRKGAFGNSASGIIKAAELVYINHIMESNEQEEQIFTYHNYTETDENGNGLKLEYKGQKPEMGQITIKEDGGVTIWLWRDGFCAVKGDNDEGVMVTEKSREVCGQAMIPPTIVIEGYANNNNNIVITMMPGDALALPEVTAKDSYDNDLTADMVEFGSVDVNTLGDYIITYTVTDSNNHTRTRSIMVRVQDNVSPVVHFSPNGDGAWRKENGSTVFVEDVHSNVDNSSLKYVWTTSTVAPQEEDFTIGFTNHTSIFDNSLTKNGTYYLWVLAKDTVGNTAIVRSNGFNFDTIAPTISGMTITATAITETGFTITRTGNAIDTNLAANPYTYQISTDGNTWTNVKLLTNDTTAQVTGLSSGNTRYYRVCAVDIALNSSCSTSKSVLIEGPEYILQKVGTDGYNGLDFGNGRWVAVGWNSVISTSTDGISWTRTKVGTNHFRAVTFANNTWIAVGDNGTVAVSTDGISWTLRTVGTESLYNAHFANNRWVVSGNGGTIATSTNTTTWSVNTIGTASYRGIQWANNRWVVVGQSSTIATSTNGTTWSSSVVGSSNYSDVYYYGGSWLALGTYGTGNYRIATSTNGTTWSTQNVIDGYSSVAYHNGKWMAVGTRGIPGTSNYYYVMGNSNDGNTWNNVVIDETYMFIGFSNNKWVALGSNLGTSLDGITWNIKNINNPANKKFKFGNNKLVAVSNNGDILTINRFE